MDQKKVLLLRSGDIGGCFRVGAVMMSVVGFWYFGQEKLILLTTGSGLGFLPVVVSGFGLINFECEMFIRSLAWGEPQCASMRAVRLSGSGFVNFEDEKSLPLLPGRLLLGLGRAVELSAFGFLDSECEQSREYSLHLCDGLLWVFGGLLAI